MENKARCRELLARILYLARHLANRPQDEAIVRSRVDELTR